MHLARRPVICAIAAVALVAASFSACGGEALTPTPAGPLVSVELRGGECFAAPCGRTVILDRDGRVRVGAKPPNDLGTVPAIQVAAIDSAIQSTDFAAMRRRPSTDICPTAFDGQEIVFTFAAPSGTERIASCDVEIDEGSPLYIAVATALSEWVPLPVQ